MTSFLWNDEQLLIVYKSYINLFMINKGAQTLPSKDAQNYKQLAKLYDSKNYKKGLKNAQKLLETHPDHPETNSLKALFLQALGQETKALQVAKLALIKSKMRSMFCWHTCASIYKQKKDFAEAAKCFQNALRLESDNLQIMREAASLQVQVRDLSNHTLSRFNILKQKPGMIQNWIAFAISHHLRGDYPSLFKALHSVDNIIKTAELKPTQLAHYYVYRVIAYRDASDFDGMYHQLHKNKNQIKDEVLYHQLLHHACISLNKTQEAVNAVEFLLKKFPDNLDYLKQYQDLHHLNKREACSRARNQFKSKIAYVHQLACIENSEQFRKQFSIFAKPYYQKNLISLHSQIQILYEAGKHDDIQLVLTEFSVSLGKDKYPDGTEVQSPSQYLWSLYLLAQHYSLRYQNLTTAHKYISEAIKHTCTVPQFYLIKAAIQYKQHNNIQSLKTVNEARKMDLADRYMNNICVKYLMKCQKPDIGENILRMFMRDDASLYELQNHWYIIEAGKSFLKQRQFEPGLRHFDFINKQFLDFQANELDFHIYCLRKWSLREYIQLIEFNDNIYDDKKYAETAGLAIRYLREYPYYLQQAQREAKNKVEDQKDEKQLKKKKKKKKQVETSKQQQNPIQVFRKKIDYYGKDYAEKIKKNPSEEAFNYAKCIASIKFTNKGNINDNKIFGRAFSEALQIFIEFKKPLLVLRCLNKLKRTLCSPFDIHHATIKAVIYLQSYISEPNSNDICKQMVTQFLQSTLQGKSLAKFNDQQILKWKQSIPSQQQFLIQTKKIEAQIFLKQSHPREQLIKFYDKQLTSLSNGQVPDTTEMKLIFYFTHRLEFYGKFSQQMKEALNKRAGSVTTYYTEWRKQLLKLPESTWSMWWLSDYDIEREQLDEKQDPARKPEQNSKTEESGNAQKKA